MIIIKAAAVQISPVLYSREGTVDRVVRKIAELGRQDVQFAAFPEAVVPYYPYFSFVQRPFEMVTEHLDEEQLRPREAEPEAAQPLTARSRLVRLPAGRKRMLGQARRELLQTAEAMRRRWATPWCRRRPE